MFTVLHISTGPVDSADEHAGAVICTSSRGEIWLPHSPHRNYPFHFTLWGGGGTTLIGESEYSAGGVGQTI